MKKTGTKPVRRKLEPALSPEEQDDQLIYLAVKLAEEQLANGTASSQVITHYLKLAQTREKERIERELLKENLELTKAKTESLKSAKNMEQLYQKAIDSMRRYRGESDEPED